MKVNGQTRLIINDLRNSMSVKEVSKKYNVSLSAVYQLAKKYKIPMEQISEEERKEKKKIADAIRNKEKRIKSLLDPSTEMPHLPMTSAKFGPLCVLNGVWVTGQGNKRSTIRGNKNTQSKYGLKS